MAGEGLTPPRLVIVAGPNGAGKSTFTKALQRPILLIDPDAFKCRPPIEAGRLALVKLDACLRASTSVVVETTLSGHGLFRRANMAAKKGFLIEIHYIGLDCPEVAIARIEERVRKGGHHVSPEDATRRFHRSLRNLPSFARLAHRCTLYDNMGEDPLPENSARAGFRPLLKIVDGEMYTYVPASEMPAWARNFVSEMLSSGTTIRGKWLRNLRKYFRRSD